jgi:photosystem II stability/assembly factor-like uncharacterized protein
MVDRLAFAATYAGIFRSRDGGESWEPCNEGLGSFMVQSILFSPRFPVDHTLYAGAADGGIYRSTDSGDGWELIAKLGSGSAIADISVAIDSKDEISIMAGSMADGVFATIDGSEWKTCNSGLSDLSVIAVAMSPSFALDKLALAATGRGLSLTTDGGGKWRQVWRPEGEDGVQCIELSPDFVADRTAFAGTERLGVIRSLDGGVTWEPANAGLAESCVNALAFSPDFASDGMVVAATAEGIALSMDRGTSWELLKASPDTALTLSVSRFVAAVGRTILAGLANQGVERSMDGGKTWEFANEGLQAASLVGMALSPNFESDSSVFGWGPSEGLLRSVDGGESWQTISGGIQAGINGAAISPFYASDRTIYVATPEGLYASQDGGTNWQSDGLAGQDVKLLALSPSFAGDRQVVAATEAHLQLSSDGGAHWRRLELPSGEDAALAVAFVPSQEKSERLLLASWREASRSRRGRLRIWSRDLPDSPWKLLFSRDSFSRIVALAIPDSYGEDQQFYVGNGDAVYRSSPGSQERTRDGVTPLWLPSPIGSRGYPVLSLATATNFGQTRALLAATADGVYISQDAGQRWDKLGETPGRRGALALGLPASFPANGTAYALEIGGQLWKWDPQG